MLQVFSCSTMSLLTQALLAPLNHVLQGNHWARERLGQHAGHSLRLSAEPFVLDCTLNSSGLFEPSTVEHAEPEVIISLPLSALPSLAVNQGQNAMSVVKLTGNAELAETVGFVLRNLSWDIEEDLSRVVGDMAAHRIVSSARTVPPLARRGAESLAGNVREYLVDEAPLLVARNQLDDLSDDSKRLRDDIARLEKRLKRLSLRPGTSGTTLR